jgi:hypothetical protein
MCFSHFYMTDQSKVGRKPSSSFNQTSTTKSGTTWSSTTKSGSSRSSTTKRGSTRSSLTLPSFKDMSELFTLGIEAEILPSPNLKVFSLSDLKAATKNFCLNNLSGEGGFSYVYKGCIDEHTIAPSMLGYMVWLLQSRS